MNFLITHRTTYRYSQPVSEAYIEARLTPPDVPGQTILSHDISFNPGGPVSSYQDAFDNTVSVYSLTRRHEHLSLVNRIKAQTREFPRSKDGLEVRTAETRQFFSCRLTEIFHYLQPTTAVPTGHPATDWVRRFFPGDAPLGPALEALNSAIHSEFRYDTNATNTSTPLSQVWKQKAGVCQDFAHIMLDILRTAGLPARYICGYIESDPVRPRSGAPRLVGSLATHAWVEVLTPGMTWVALDPTNNQWCGPRHVTMSYGRDFEDAAPVRGTFKGSGKQKMDVKVTMRRQTASDQEPKK